MGALGEQVIQEEFINLPSKDISIKVVQPEYNLFLCRERAQGLSPFMTHGLHTDPLQIGPWGAGPEGCPLSFMAKMVINFFIHNWTVKS